MSERPAKARLVAGFLWIVLALGVVTIIVMTWHPWVAGNRVGCPAGTAQAWDGHCYPVTSP